MDIQLHYSGSYPNLCSGHLKVYANGVWYDFPSYCLSSGGGVWFDDSWCEHVDEGPWSINKWPENFPIELKGAVIEAVNNQIEHGCCGGCV